MPIAVPTINAVDALTWLAQDPSRQPQTLLALLALEVGDTLGAATDISPDTRACAELVALADEAVEQMAPSTLDRVMETVGLVGARVWLEEPENVDEWAAVATSAQACARDAGSWGYSPGASQWAAMSSVDVIAEVRAAGRSPHYAQTMLEAAQRAKLAPNTFGYGSDISPAALISLAGAGVRTASDLALITDSGLSVAEALALAEAGLTPDQVKYAASTGMAPGDWVANLAGLPNAWFSVVDGRASSFMVAAGFTWAELRQIAEAGWSGFQSWDWRNGLRYGSRHHSGAFTREVLLLAVSLGTRSEIENWLTALTSGKVDRHAGRLAKTLPPLTDMRRGFAEVLADVARLKDAGLRSSHLNTYRAAGCARVEDVLTASAAGITPKRAKELLEVHGKRRFKHDPVRIESVALLLAAHRADAEQVAS